MGSFVDGCVPVMKIRESEDDYDEESEDEDDSVKGGSDATGRDSAPEIEKQEEV